MRCPKCSSDKLSVTETRTEAGSIRRRRICADCDFRFTTFERAELVLPIIVKKDGKRQVFDPDKIRQGLIRSCQKRPVELAQIDQTVQEIKNKIAERGDKEISSNVLGEEVLAALKALDKIAFMRFVSVYHEFENLDQFSDAITELKS